jgi:hypothetical protein
MSRKHRNLLIAWMALLLLGGVEFAGSFVHFSADYRPLLLVPALVMVGLVGMAFMQVRTGPSLSRSFSVAALCWLTVLLGLGMMDPFTRAIYAITH